MRRGLRRGPRSGSGSCRGYAHPLGEGSGVSEGARPPPQTSPPNPPLPRRPLPRASGEDAVGRGGLGIGGEQLAQGNLAELVVAEAYDVDRQPGQGLGTESVVLGLRGIVMGTAVELEDQAQRRAVEVDDEAGDELLTAEFEAQDRFAAQQLPGFGFGRRLLSTKAAREGELAWIDGGATSHGGRARRVHDCSSTRGRRKLRGSQTILLLRAHREVCAWRQAMATPQGLLPYTIEVVDDDATLTAHAGLPLVVETMRALGVSEVLDGALGIRRRKSGATDAQKVEALVLLLAAG